MVICLERGANDLHVVQLMPLPPHHLLLQQNPEWFILLLTAYPGCPGKRPLNICVCVWHISNIPKKLHYHEVKKSKWHTREMYSESEESNMAIHSMASHDISPGHSETARAAMASNNWVHCDQMETQTVRNRNTSHYQWHHKMFCPYAIHIHMQSHIYMHKFTDLLQGIRMLQNIQVSCTFLHTLCCCSFLLSEVAARQPSLPCSAAGEQGPTTVGVLLCLVLFGVMLVILIEASMKTIQLYHDSLLLPVLPVTTAGHRVMLD